MKQLVCSMILFCMSIGFSVQISAFEINYDDCGSIEDVIGRETQEIEDTDSENYEELAQLYVSRGESYLLNAQYEKALDDFQSANSYIGHAESVNSDMMIAFRVAFGEIVSYDNLGMTEQTQQALEQLQIIASHVGCDDCIEEKPCQGKTVAVSNQIHYSEIVKLAINTEHFQSLASTCKHKKHKEQAQQEGSPPQPAPPQQSSPPQENNNDDYSDILGPDIPPPNWCKEVVVGVMGAMQVIASAAPNWGVRAALLGVLEALKQRGVTCCEAGGFWKACVAPITRKWREWKNNKSKGIYPNQETLPLFVN